MPRPALVQCTLTRSARFRVLIDGTTSRSGHPEPNGAQSGS